MTEPDAFQQMAASRDEAAWTRIEPANGDNPQIGALVQMLEYTRLTTLQAVRDLSVDELDAVPSGVSNSIGMLLAHVAATDRLYQAVSFEGRDPFEAPDYAPYVGAMTFGWQGETVRGRDLDGLLSELAGVRGRTLAELARRDDAWLASQVTAPGFEDMNQHWAWFHVMEDEVNHRGQMRLIRKMLKATAPG